MNEKDCPKCGGPMRWKNLEVDRCESCEGDISEHKPDPEFVKYMQTSVKNPFLSAPTVMQMERVFIDQRNKYEAKLQAAREQEGE
ncbi:hypothetical protein [Marinobacter phage PS6]|nr:hypothetical protein [Marinobacter phage PS6]